MKGSTKKDKKPTKHHTKYDEKVKVDKSFNEMMELLAHQANQKAAARQAAKNQ
jgi:hypothetical protein